MSRAALVCARSGSEFSLAGHADRILDAIIRAPHSLVFEGLGCFHPEPRRTPPRRLGPS
jgi:hypothetical protein